MVWGAAGVLRPEQSEEEARERVGRTTDLDQAPEGWQALVGMLRVPSALVAWGCPTKGLRPSTLKQQKRIVSKFWRPDL